MVEQLIAAGHRDPLSYTPRQAIAFAELAAKRRKRERLEDFRLMRIAFGGNEEAVKMVEKEYGDVS